MEFIGIDTMNELKRECIPRGKNGQGDQDCKYNQPTRPNHTAEES
jgi:hypothetical protein